LQLTHIEEVEFRMLDSNGQDASSGPIQIRRVTMF